MTASRYDPILRDIAAAVSASADEHDDAVLDPNLLARSSRLHVDTPSLTPHERALLGSYHLLRYMRLPEGPDEAALTACSEWYQSVLPDHPELVPPQFLQPEEVDPNTDIDRFSARTKNTEGVEFASAASTLCGMLDDRFEVSQDVRDLHLAIHHGTAAYLTPALPARVLAPVAANLAIAHLHLAEHTGSDDHLDRAVTLLREAADLAPTADHHGNLASALYTRFENQEQPSDLEAALEYSAKAVTPPAHAQAGWLSLRGAILCTAYLRSRVPRPELLTEAEAAGRRAVVATAPDSPHYAGRATNLAITLATRFGSVGSVELLAEAEQFARDAVDDTPARLANLASILRAHGVARGDQDRIEEAFRIALRAATAVPIDHLDRPDLLSEAANSAMTWFDWSGDLPALTTGVTLGRWACDALDDSTPHRYGSALTNHAMHLLTYAEATDDAGQLSEALRYAELACRHLPDDPNVLSNVALLSRLLADTASDPERRSASVGYAERALAAAHRSHIDEAPFLANLAQCLWTDTHGERARSIAEKAVAVTDPGRSEYQAFVAILARIADSEGDDAETRWRTVADAESTPIPLRAEARLQVAAHAAQRGDWNTSTAAYSAAIADTAELAWHGIDPLSRLLRLTDHADTAADGAAAALHHDDAPAALVMLERGRSLVLGSDLDTRGDVHRLRRAHPGMARRLVSLAAARRDL